MDQERILGILRSHAPELRAAGLEHLRLFGSVARGTSGPQSDVDLLADFAPEARLTLVSIAGMQDHLAQLLEANVELSSAAWMRPRIREQVLREAILAF